MPHPHPLKLLLPVLLFAACSEDQPPTAPAASGELAASHTPGHKVVNSLADPGNGPCNATQCTLREAINDPQSTEISFAAGLTGTITLAAPVDGGGPLSIDKRLSITGPTTGIAIRRRSTDPDFRIFQIFSEGDVTLSKLTIRGGSADFGGGIANGGRLTLTQSTVAHNLGGGIVNREIGNLILEGSTVANNTGAGILDRGGTVTLRNSTIVDNSAGVTSRLGTLTLAGSTVARNAGTGVSSREGALTVTRCRVAGNGFSGIVSEGGSLTLTHSTVARNAGVGVASVGLFPVRVVATLTNVEIVGNRGGIASSRANVALTNSTVAGNSSPFSGGGISNCCNGAVTITNSTIAGNSATEEGGGIFNEGEVRQSARVSLTNSTVSGNTASSGGGIFNSGRGEFTVSVGLTNSTVADNSATVQGGGISTGGGEDFLFLGNSLVARNSAPDAPDVLIRSSANASARFSLIGDGSGSGVTNTNGNQVGTASEPIDPRLGPLADNGGPTQTHALLLGSPAIDAASTPDCPTTDQRGVLRPQGAACDIGSYERE